MDHEDLPFETDAFAGALAELLSLRGQTREVAILSVSTLDFKYWSFDSWDGGTHKWNLTIRTPIRLYAQFTGEEIKAAEQIILLASGEIWRDTRHDFNDFQIAPVILPKPDWREQALQWLKGEGINNQGRVRSDNVAAREEDGLLFRSPPEIFLYRAFKESGVTFAPLPVFLKGGPTYQRIEPDFVLFRNKFLMIVEVDGDTIHRESPAEADKRTRLFKYEGAFIEHVSASECDSPETAKVCAKRLVGILHQLSLSR
jgi:hypothetical protein